MNTDHPIFRLAIDSDLGRTESEFLFLGTCEDIVEKIKRGKRYDIIRASGLLRHLLCDGERLVDAANRRFRMKLDFNDPIMDSDLSRQAMAVLRAHDSIAWIPPNVLMHDSTRPRISLQQFLKVPVTYHRGEPSLTVHNIIDTCAHVYGGVHSGVPKSDQSKLIVQMDDSMIIGGSPPSLTALYAICIVALDGLMPLIEGIHADGQDPVEAF